MRNIALLIETSNAYARGLLRGIISFVRENNDWSVSLAEHGRGDRPPPWLGSWKARREGRAVAPDASGTLIVGRVDRSDGSWRHRGGWSGVRQGAPEGVVGGHRWDSPLLCRGSHRVRAKQADAWNAPKTGRVRNFPTPY